MKEDGASLNGARRTAYDRRITRQSSLMIVQHSDGEWARGEHRYVGALAVKHEIIYIHVGIECPDLPVY